jgi:cytochrome c-type biogenesis protein CcmH
MKRMVLFLAIIASVSVFTFAKEARSISDDPELEKRVMALSEELRCLVCQNETLAGSHADLAADLRQEIREQMKAGKSDKEIVAFLTERYGDFILYNPPIKARTYLLWFGPFILLGGGLFAFYRYIKARRELIAEQPLSAEQRKRAEDLLQAAPGKEAA